VEVPTVLHFVNSAFGLVWLRPIRSSEVKLGNGPNKPREVLPKLQCLPLLDQVRQAVLHRQAVLLVHFELVSDPVAIGKSQNALSQLVVARINRLIVDDLLLDLRVLGEDTLPVVRYGIGSLHGEFARNLIYLLFGQLRNGQVNPSHFAPHLVPRPSCSLGCLFLVFLEKSFLRIWYLLI